MPERASTNDAASARWDAEYARGGVPSSVRSGPSGALVDYVQRFPIAAGLAVDICCGRGRNAAYLASLGLRAIGLDYSVSALAGFPRDAAGAVRADISRGWPLRTAVADFALDAFCFKHLIDPDDVAAYVSELARVLKPGAPALFTLAPPEDGFYGACPREEDAHGRFVVRDAEVGAFSVLYTPEEMAAIFGGDFVVAHIGRRERPGEMHGRAFPRTTDAYRLIRRP